jgi:hypothetical protein
MSAERVLAPQDAQGKWTTDDAEDYYIPTYDVTKYQSWKNPETPEYHAAQMYDHALESCWDGEKS